jgi:hypothetical protein
MSYEPVEQKCETCDRIVIAPARFCYPCRCNQPATPTTRCEICNRLTRRYRFCGKRCANAYSAKREAAALTARERKDRPAPDASLLY